MKILIILVDRAICSTCFGATNKKCSDQWVKSDVFTSGECSESYCTAVFVSNTQAIDSCLHLWILVQISNIIFSFYAFAYYPKTICVFCCVCCWRQCNIGDAKPVASGIKKHFYGLKCKTKIRRCIFRCFSLIIRLAVQNF